MPKPSSFTSLKYFLFKVVSISDKTTVSNINSISSMRDREHAVSQVPALNASSISDDTSSVNSTTDDDTPEATVKAAKSISILTAVYTQANATLGAIKQTAAALDAVEKAAEAVERAKGQHDDTVSCFPNSCPYSTVYTCNQEKVLSTHVCMYR